METHVRAFWEQYGLSAQRLTLVGVSGGADSLALLSAMHAAGLPVAVAHFDHALRPESAADARYVQEVCHAMGVPVVVGRADVRAMAQEQHLSLEDAARRVRYAFLFTQAEKQSAQAVAVAHTADDQVETVLMHLLTGSGLDGLRGMQPCFLPNPWSEHIPLVRPLLRVTRQDVLRWCRQQGLQPLADATNQDRRFLRNRLRLDVLPLLETCNPQVRAALLSVAQLAEDAEEALAQWALEAGEVCVRRRASGCVQVDVTALRALPRAVQQRVLRHTLRALGGDLRELGYAGLERVRTLSSGHLPLPGGLRAVRDSDGLWLLVDGVHPPTDDWPQVDAATRERLPVPGEVAMAGGWRIRAQWVEDIPAALAAAQGNENPFQAWLALRERDTVLRIAVPQPGVRLRPLGMRGHTVKVFDLMSNAHIPRRVRAHWPLVYAGDSVAWVPGLHMDEAFRLSSHTPRAVFLRCWRADTLGQTG